MAITHTPSALAGETTDQKIGKAVRFRRRLMKMSQTTLGEALGVTFQQVQKYERGINRVSAATLMDIAQVLGVPVIALYPLEDERTADNDLVLSMLSEDGGIEVARLWPKLANTDKRSFLHLMEGSAAKGRAPAPRDRATGSAAAPW